MPRQRLRVCNQPGCPNLQHGPRCPEHERDNERHRRATTPTKIHREADKARRKAFIDQHRATFGDWCPGYQRDPHPATDLTADHIEEINLGGDPHGPLQALCRSCNGRKAMRAIKRP